MTKLTIAIAVPGEAGFKGPNRTLVARFATLWKSGLNTHQIANELNIQEYELVAWVLKLGGYRNVIRHWEQAA